MRGGVRSAFALLGFFVVGIAACGSDEGGGVSSSSGSPTGGCGGGSGQKGFLGAQSIASGTYQLFVPDDYDSKKPYPLVLVFHGDGGSGTNIRSSFKLEAETKNGAIVAYPDGKGKTFQIDGKDKLAGDIAFADAVIADVQGRFCTDLKRTFAVGFSKGAYFVNQLACRTSATLKGIVTHAGGGPFGVDNSEFEAGELKCPAAPVAALQVQGDSDTSVPPAEGQKARDHWIGANGCGATTKPYDPSPCVAYDGCARPEVYCAIPSLGHEIWPQSGAKVTWSFLSSL